MQPALALGLVAALLGLVLHKIVLTRALDALETETRARLLDPSLRSSHVWTAGLIIVTAGAFVLPRYGLIAIAGFLAASGWARVRRLRGAGFPPAFVRAAGLSLAALAGGMFVFGVCAWWTLRS